MESAEHIFREQPGHDLLDVLCSVVVSGVDQHFRLRTGGTREEQRHAPIGDIGMIKGRLERLVFDKHPLIRGELPRERLSGTPQTSCLRWRMFAVPG